MFSAATQPPSGFWSAGAPVWLILSTALGGAIAAFAQVRASKQSARNEHIVYLRALYEEIYDVARAVQSETHDYAHARHSQEFAATELVHRLQRIRDMTSNLQSLAERSILMGSPLIGLELVELVNHLGAFTQGPGDKTSAEAANRSIAKIIDRIRRSLGIGVTPFDRVQIAWLLTRRKHRAKKSPMKQGE